MPPETSIAMAAGYAFRAGGSGDCRTWQSGRHSRATGLYNATGEDFLHSYLGMLGIPIDLQTGVPGRCDR